MDNLATTGTTSSNELAATRTLSTEEILSMTGEIVVFKAQLIATEETVRYENEHPDEIFDAELRNMIIERAISQLTFATCNFHCPKGISDEMELKKYYDDWFAAEEEPRLRRMCYHTIRKELEERHRPGDAELSFTDRYLRQVKENTNSRISEKRSQLPHGPERVELPKFLTP